MTNPRREKVNVVSSSSCQENVEKESQQDEGGWETYISKKTKYMMKVLLAIEGIRRKNALELEVDPRLLRLKESTEEDPSPSKKKALKYYKDQERLLCPDLKEERRRYH